MFIDACPKCAVDIVLRVLSLTATIRLDTNKVGDQRGCHFALGNDLIVPSRVGLP